MSGSSDEEFKRLYSALDDAINEYDSIITEINKNGPSDERNKRLAAADRKEKSARRALDKYMKQQQAAGK